MSTSALLLGVPWALAFSEEQQVQEMEREMRMQQSANEVRFTIRDAAGHGETSDKGADDSTALDAGRKRWAAAGQASLVRNDQKTTACATSDTSGALFYSSRSVLYSLLMLPVTVSALRELCTLLTKLTNRFYPPTLSSASKADCRARTARKPRRSCPDQSFIAVL